MLAHLLSKVPCCCFFFTAFSASAALTLSRAVIAFGLAPLPSLLALVLVLLVESSFLFRRLF
jgi:hypothetical protein